MIKLFPIRSHEYLIDQLQFQGTEPILFGASTSYKFRLNFNHPVKELVWALQRSVNNTIGTAYNDWLKVSQ